MTNKTYLNNHDVKILRELGEWKARTSEIPENREKIQAWIQHDAGVPNTRVMVIAETWYTTDKCCSVNENELKCSDPWARGIEWSFRLKKFEIEVLRDDHMVQSWVEYTPHVHASNFGIPSSRYSKTDVNLAFQYHAQLKNLDEADFARIHHREFRWDRESEEHERRQLEAVFAGILKVRRRNGGWQLSLPITNTCLDFVGLDGFMTLMYDNPEGLHRLMAFIRDDHLAYLRFFEENNLLELNNESDYIGSGCMGFSKQLPAADFSGIVRTKDLWYFCESQESVGIRPEHYGEFVFPYISAIAKRFGRVYYGCCEGVDPVWKYISTLPNLKRVSVSPWANEEKVGKYCRESGVVYSRKSSPNFYVGAEYNEGAVRTHLEKTVACAEGCRLEFIQRDVYTVNNEPERFTRWVELAREVGNKHRG